MSVASKILLKARKRRCRLPGLEVFRRDGSPPQRSFLVVMLAVVLEICMHQVLPGAHRKSAYAFRLWPDKVQALVTYDTMRLNDFSLPWTVRNGRYMPVGLHTPRLTVVAVKVWP